MGERAGAHGLGAGILVLGGGEGLPVTSPQGDIEIGFRPGSLGTGSTIKQFIIVNTFHLWCRTTFPLAIQESEKSYKFLFSLCYERLC